jgi:hypothetical protein
MVPQLTRRSALAGITSTLALSSGCLGTAESGSQNKSEPLACPESGETTVSCVRDHPKIDLRPATVPLNAETSNQSFILRNRSRKAVTVNTAGVRIFRWEADSWTELGSEKRNMTGSTIRPGDAFYWVVRFSKSRDDVLVRDAEVVFPKGETGQYAATVTVEDEDMNELRCGTLFEIE